MSELYLMVSVFAGTPVSSAINDLPTISEKVTLKEIPLSTY